jgi:hypothetical protein
MKAILTDGIKSTTFTSKNIKGVDVWNPDSSPEAWTGQIKADAYALVPAVQSAWQARCKAIADLPFTIYNQRGDEVDNSDDYKNVVGFMPNPRKFLWMTESALVGYGRAYWLKKSNIYNITKEMQYFLPTSIECELTSKGLESFRRNNGLNTTKYKPEEILYVFLPDPSVEIGPPTVYPLASAMLSAKSLERINVFINDYMARGAVKAMLLSAKNMPSQEEAARVETWFNKFMRGVGNLRWKLFNAEEIKPTIVGEGLEAFKGISIIDDLTRQVHTAMGTRHMLEDENYATADVRQREFYLTTVVPDARIIGDAMNEQILGPMNLRIEFDPERLEVFGDDEAANMTAFSTVSSSLSNSSPEVIELALSLAGVVLTQEQEDMLDEMKSEKEDNKEKMDEQMQPKDEPVDPEDEAEKEDLAKWERKALKRIGKDVPFLSNNISQEEQDRIHNALPGCTSEAEIKSVFETQLLTPAVKEFVQIATDYSHLIEAMKLEVTAIKESQVQIDTEEMAGIISRRVCESIKPSPDREAVVKAIRSLSNG